MKRIGLLLGFLMLFLSDLKADEGMWLPYLLNQKDVSKMQSLGCKLSSEQIFSFNQSSIKDAIVQFGGGCTGELISAEGLLLTNHHCGIGQVQAHSTIENDYLKEGFWAYEKEKELPNPGLSVSFLIEVKDITSIILEGIGIQLSGNERIQKIEANKKLYLDQLEKKHKNRESKIVSFYYDNQYMLFVYDVYKDVRLVGCPPWGIGKFGADTDNWTWPRQKGDFCIFRVYTAPDGTPADYAKENIPMKSKHFLPISIKGVQEGDYTMIMGYPGSTNRYAPSQAIEMIINQTGPSIIDCRTEKLKIIRTHSDASPEVFIKYASKQASVSNYWKYYIGQVKQLQKNKVVEKRKNLEDQFAKWVAGNNEKKNLYGTVLSDFEKAYSLLSKYEKALMYHREAGYRGGEAITFAGLFNEIDNHLQKKSPDSVIQRMINKLESEAEKFYKDYDVETDKEVTAALFLLFYKDISIEMQPEFIQKVGKTEKGNFEKYVAKLFQKSIFTSKERFEKWKQKPVELKNDPIFEVMTAFYKSFYLLRKATEEARLISQDANRLFMAGIMEMQPENDFYPNANFTMRLTYGNVKDYKPADAITYAFESTMVGVMQKEIPGNWEFDIPEKLRALYEKKEYGIYAKEGEELVVNFISNNDITGGNSGSPVLDGEGNLVGLAFDGNWEAMSGDLSFEPNVQRTISMDARYLLFVLDQFANAQNLIQELKIIR